MNEPCGNSGELEAVCERYLALRRGAWHPHTVRHHACHLRRFLQCLHAGDPQVQRFDQVRRSPHIERWLADLQTRAAVTREKELLNVRQFFHAQIDWGWPHAPVENLIRAEDFPRLPRTLPKPLNPDDDRRLDEALRQDPGLRSLAILLLRRTGLRIGELLALDVEALGVDAQGKPLLRVAPGKTCHERLIPLSEETAALIGRILECRGSRRAPEPPHARKLLVDEFGQPLSYIGLWRHIKRIGRHGGVCPHQSLHPHRLRHTFATELARTDIPFPSLMRLLGHRLPHMTLRYVELSGRDIRAAYERAMDQLPALPPRAAPPHPDAADPRPAIGEDLERLIAQVERRRRDRQGFPAEAQTLARLVKRLRAAQQDFKKTA